METALITWIIIAAFAIVMMIYDIFLHHKSGNRHKSKIRYSHPFEIGNECDGMYIPGDINSGHDSDIIEYEEELV